MGPFFILSLGSKKINLVINSLSYDESAIPVYVVSYILIYIIFFIIISIDFF